MIKKISFDNLKGLDIDPSGLKQDDIDQQRARYGLNEIIEYAGNPWLNLISDTIKDPMIWFLVGIGLIFMIVGDQREAITLFLAVLPLVFMDAFLHWRTETSTVVLKSNLAATACVIREKREILVDSREIVPGDLVSLSVMHPFLPADGYWETGSALQIDESILTGEAMPVSKKPLGFKPYGSVLQSIADTESAGYAGTRVLTGNGTLRVAFTGRQTAYGEIVQSVSEIKHERTALQKSIANLTKNLVYAAALFCILLAVIRLYQGHGWLDALLSAATLAIAAIPEEFPVVFTFFLGVGVYRLARRNALVRKAVSVENIGRITQICTDKTGTITVGKLKLTHIEKTSDFSENDVLVHAALASNQNGSDPVDQALFEAIALRNIERPHRFNAIPFTEDRKRETGFFRRKSRYLCSMKGAPETVLLRSALSKNERSKWLAQVAEWAEEGHKILAVAYQEITKKSFNAVSEPDKCFTLCGFLAFEDPPRPEVNAAMKYCRQNGIKVLILTGDHPSTATKIARDIELTKSTPVVVSAADKPEKFQQSWLDRNSQFLKKIDVVARCTPLQKLYIVQSLKNSGELVAVTGDGVNDVPALKAANIGIAMGLRGARSAKETSSIILTDDNFSTIVNAIKEGRQLFSNLRMSFEYLLLVHIPFVLSAAIVPLLGYPLLYLPVHVVWLELIIHPTALFAFQLPTRKQAGGGLKAQSAFFNRRDTLRIFSTGLIATAILMFSYIARVSESNDVTHARSQVLALLSLWSAAIVVVMTEGRNRASVITAASAVCSAVVLIQIQFTAELLHISPLHFFDWAVTAGIALVFSLFLRWAIRVKKDHMRKN